MKAKVIYYPPSFESLSNDKKWDVVQELKKKNEKEKRRTIASWCVTALICSPGILFISYKPFNDAVSLVSNALSIAGKVANITQSASDATNLSKTVDDPKIMAFLDTMGWAEGTGDKYDVAVGYTGADLWSFNSRLDSDAWGRYQYISTTAKPILDKLGIPYDDFRKPEVQDKVVVEHLKELGIYNKIIEGDIDSAICDAGSQWASFACSTAGQNPKSMEEIKKVYAEKLAARQGQKTEDTVTPIVSSTGVIGLPSIISNDSVTSWLTAALAKPFNLTLPGDSIPPVQIVNKVFPIEGQTLATAIPTSDYGLRVHPIHGDERMHYGKDFGADAGTPLVATESATVTDVVNQDIDGCGLSVTYQIANGDEIRYCHMSEVSVSLGDKLNAGQIVGKVGNTGGSTGSHLHFEVHHNGSAIDPNPYLNSIATADNPPVITSSTNGFIDFCIPMNGDGLCGSGVAVGKDLILTVKHVTDDAKGVVISDQDSTRMEFKYEVLASDGDRDLALLKVKDATFTPVQLADKNPDVGSTITTYGHANGEQKLSNLTQSITNSDMPCGITIKCYALPEGITPGYSGGRVMSGDRLVGVNRSLLQVDKTGRFVSIEEIRQFMKNSGVL